jgi:hypothetical protein
VLLDTYPTVGHGRLEVHTNGRVLPIGQLDESAHVQKVASAQAAIRTVVGEHLFAFERETTFEFIYHFDTVDAWLEYMSTRWTGAVVGPDLIARVRQSLTPGHGELRIRRNIHAARLRRV